MWGPPAGGYGVPPAGGMPPPGGMPPGGPMVPPAGGYPPGGGMPPGGPMVPPAGGYPPQPTGPPGAAGAGTQMSIGSMSSYGAPPPTGYGGSIGGLPPGPAGPYGGPQAPGYGGSFGGPPPGADPRGGMVPPAGAPPGAPGYYPPAQGPPGAYSSFSAPAPQVAPSIQPQGSMGHPPSGGGSFTGSMGHPPSGGGSSFSGSYPPSSSSCPPGQFPVQTPKHQEQHRCLLIVKVHKARNLKWLGATRLIGFTRLHPFVTVLCEKTKLGNTAVASAKDTEPEWNESFFGITSAFLPETPPSSWVTIAVRDYSDLRTPEVGTVSIQPVQATGPESYQPQWHTLARKKGKGEILVSAVSIPVEEAFKWAQTPSADFPLRKGCNVRLYQDAHCPSLLPHLPPRNAFEDMYHSIQNAKRFIYLTGWSVWTKLQLLRDRPCPLLGDLLKQKASEGVQVCIIIWDEFTSFEKKKRDDPENAASGFMNTFDEETRAFFKNSGVHLQAMFRSGHQRIEEIYFSHHQKTIIVDEGPRMVAYVGGLDVTNGRWDGPDHSLFSTLQTAHKDDWYQPSLPVATQESGPRQPWHDIHSRVEGEIALDVYENFRQRWNHNPTNPHSGWGEFHEGAKLVEHIVIDTYDIIAPDIVKEEVAQKWTPPPALRDAHKEFPNGGVPSEGNWSCQLLRSIDCYSIDVSGDMSKVIRSIHNSYVLRIATAQRYIYIENQYFMGSSHYWASKQDPGLRNLVPIAIVDKIISKIALGEDFCCYAIIPLHPEGDPETISVKALLRWQYNTVKMMHKRIYDAIKTYKVPNKSVEDYFVLMCLGNREDPNLAGRGGAGKASHGAILNGRFMIYVHSKMMIVDDEFILIGSANINDRSLRGNRDTEIAVVSNKRGPQGLPQFSQEICDFRMSLWVEHFGAFNNVFLHPQSTACNHHIRQIADANWKIYENDAWTPETRLHGHACTYPYTTQVGEVDPPPGAGTFPDFKLSCVVGEVTVLPNTVTT